MAERLAVIDRLIERQETEKRLDDELAEVRQGWQHDWAEAVRLGWTKQELQKLKLRTPPDISGKPARKPRGSSRAGVTRTVRNNVPSARDGAAGESACAAVADGSGESVAASEGGPVPAADASSSGL